MKVVKNPAAFFALQLHHYTKDNKFDHDAVIRILLTRFEKDLDQIRVEYRQRFDEALESVIRQKTSGDERRALLALCAYDTHPDARHGESSSSSSSSSSSESEKSSSDNEKSNKKHRSTKHSKKRRSSKHNGLSDDDEKDDTKKSTMAVVAQTDSALGSTSRASSTREPSRHAKRHERNKLRSTKSEKVVSSRKKNKNKSDSSTSSSSASSSSDEA